MGTAIRQAITKIPMIRVGGGKERMPRLTNVQLSRKNPYWLPKTVFLTTYYHCLSYQSYKDEYIALSAEVGVSGISYDNIGSSSHSIGSATESQAIELAELSYKIATIDSSVREACKDHPELIPYLHKAVTQEGIKYHYLSTVMHIPCTEKMFYNLRRKIYWICSKKSVHVPKM